MDGPLKGAPGFVYVKELSVSIVVNKHGEPIVFTDDPVEMDWLFNWINNYDKHRMKPVLYVLQDQARKANDFRREQQHSQPLEPRLKPKTPKPLRKRDENRVARGRYARRPAHTRSGPKRQLIGEQIGPTRMHQLRLFQTQQEAESWAREGVGRRFRFATIGSVGWTRALDEEMKVLQQTQMRRSS